MKFVGPEQIVGAMKVASAGGLRPGSRVVALRATSARATRGARRRRRRQVQACRQHAPDAVHRDLPRRPRGEDGEAWSPPATTPCSRPRGIPASKDTAPQALVEGLDFDKMKQEYGVLGASLNGPKLWLSDWTDIDVGKERELQRHHGRLGRPAEHGQQHQRRLKRTPYKPMTIARKSGVGWNKGTTVLLLDDAEGNTWIMKGFQLGLKPHTPTRSSWPPGQSKFKKLPPGWKFRVKTLEQGLDREAGRRRRHDHAGRVLQRLRQDRARHDATTSRKGRPGDFCLESRQRSDRNLGTDR